MLRRGTTILLLAGVVLARGGQEKGPPKGERNVLLLAKTQLLGEAKAFDAFAARNAARKRSELRAEVIGELKRIAAAEQPKILEALGSPAGARSLWLVNAIALRLSGEKIEEARKLATVKWVYPAGALPEEGAPGAVAEVLRPAARKPFTTKKKKIPWNLEGLHVPEVWKKLQILGEGAVVAMFDAGVDYRHEDLRSNIWINADEVPGNGKDDDGNGVADDLYGFDFARMRAEVLPLRNQHHGTFTASVVAGDGTGGVITGVAPRARLMALRAGGGPYLAARAFQYALENGADVVNMSFSIPNLGHVRGLWRLMAEHATCAGLILVSGAGNFPNVKIPAQIRIPEGIPCVVCVGGVTAKRKFARFTSQGPVEWGTVRFYEDFPMPKGLVKPDVCAFPGPKIALVSTGNAGYLPENNRKRGNSLSAPHAAGTCALMLSANPELTPWRIKEILETTATDLRPRGKDPRTGAGLIHAFRAVQAAQKK